MLDITLVDITPNFCPDCGTKLMMPHNFKIWRAFRTQGEPFPCICGMTIYFVKDLETVIRRITDETES